jgi:hypothetical protein
MTIINKLYTKAMRRPWGYLYKADLHKADLHKADLHRALLPSANLREANLRVRWESVP